MNRHLLVVLLGMISITALAGQQAPTPQDAPERMHVDSKILRGLMVKKVNPVYPPLARQARIQGTVVLKAEINKSGDITDIKLVSGHPMLAPAAIAAVRHWKYQPYLLNGEAVDVETDLAVNFALAGKPSAAAAGGGLITPPADQASVAPTNSGSADHLATPQRVRVSSGVISGLIVSKVQPQYPPDAREQGIQGMVLLNVIVDQQGGIAAVDLISGDPLLAPAAIEAVKQWKYRPYLLNGNPVEVETQIQVSFTLSR
jgi:TonB family protein